RTDCLQECERHRSGRTSDPFPRFEEFHIPLFQRSRFRFEIVNPPRQGRQTHQDRLGSAASFQTKNRASVVKKIELHIPAPPVKLKLTLTIGIGFINSPADDRNICRKKLIAQVGYKRKILLPVSFHVIEKKAPHTAGFTAMLEIE